MALAATTLLAAGSTTAFASPSGGGWSGSWEYTSASVLTVSATVAGAALAATGTDTGSSRVFSVALTDTNGNDGLCAWVSWTDGALNTTILQCGGTQQFTPASSDGDVSFTLCLTSINGPREHCNHMVIPSTTSEPFLRAAGWGFTWDYVDQYDNVWDATLNLGGIADVSLTGFDNDPHTNERYLEPYAQSWNAGLNCVYLDVLETSPARSGTYCDDDTDGPGDTVGTNTSYTTFEGCIWSELTILGLPDPHYCITGSVPVPN